MILDEAINVTFKNKKFVKWIVIIEEQLKKQKFGSEGNPREVLINVVLPISF